MKYTAAFGPRAIARSPRLTALTLATLLAPCALLAQNATPSPAAPPADTADQTVQLNQFVVTGSMAPRTVLESPLSITTLDRNKIDEVAPRSTAELLKVVPGLYTESSGGEVLENVLVRGIELSGAYTYIVLQEDGLPVTSESTLRYASADLFTRMSDMIEKVDALRGGSANIFASNASQALVNFISREGGSTVQGNASFTTSSYDTLKTEAWTSGPLGQNTTFAIGGWYRVDNGERDPGFPYANRGGQILGNVKHTFAGGKGYIKVSAKALDDHNIFDVPMPMQNASNPQSIPFGPNIRTDPTASSQDARRIGLQSSPVGPFSYDNANGVHSSVSYVGAEFSYEIVDGLRFMDRFRYTTINRSIDYYLNGVATPWQTLANSAANRSAAQFAPALNGSSYTFELTYPGQGNAVAAANPAAAAALGNGYGMVKTFDHAAGPITDVQDDLRLTQALNQDQTHVSVGVYFSDLNNSLAKQFNQVLTDVTPQYHRVDITYLNATTGAVVGPGTYNGVYQFGSTYTNDTSTEREVSPYIEVEHKWGHLNIDAGIRHSVVKENASIELTQAVNANTTTTGTNPALLNFQTGNGNYVSDPLSFNNNVWTIGANYAFTQHLSVFARYSDDARFISLTDLTENYHSGRIGSQGNPTNYIKQGEVGVKSGFGPFAVFLTAFRIDLTNVFMNTVITDPVTNVQSNLASFQNNLSQGVELETLWSPLPGLSLGLSGVADDSKLTDNNTERQTLLNGTSVLINDNGLIPARTPKIYGTFTASYRLPETKWGTFSVNGSYQYTGKRFSDLANSNPTPLKAFGEAVLGASFFTRSGIALRVEVNNVFNQFGLTEGDPRTGNAIIDPSAKSYNARPILPRTVQGTISYRF